MSILKHIGATIIAGLVTVTGWMSPQPQQITQPTPDQVQTQPQLGADGTLPIAGTVYTLAGSGISSSATSITLSSLTIPQTGYAIQDSDLSSTFYVTLEPGSRTRQELASCTTVTQNGNGTATLSGCTRGLLPFTPYTASSTYQFAHAGGSSMVFSNAPQLYNEFLLRSNAGYVTGIHTYATSAIPRVTSTYVYGAGDELKFVTYGQLASTSFSGTVDASVSQKGLVEVATSGETQAGYSIGNTTAPLVPDNRIFSFAYRVSTTVPVTNSSGTIAAGFIATSSDYSWSGVNSFNGTTTFNGPLVNTASSTFSTTTFSIAPIAPTSTPAGDRSLVTKYYADTHSPLFVGASTTAATWAAAGASSTIATSTFSLTNPARMMVNFIGSALTGNTNGSACVIYLVVNGTNLGVMNQVTNVPGAAQMEGNISFTYITSLLSSGSNTIVLRGESLLAQCAGTGLSLMQYSIFGQ